MLGGFEGIWSPEKNEIWCSLVYISIKLCLKNLPKLTYFYLKTNSYSFTLGMVYLATEEISKNMLQLMRYGLYFERVLNKNDNFHIEIIISVAHMLEDSGACSPRKF